MNYENRPILTVLITAYNHEGTIARCIDSVLKQKTKYPYTIWILEDCSTDKTLKICKKYLKSNPKIIKLITQKKNTKGLHTAEARAKIKTKYFAVLEGDDRWCDDKKIEISISVLENNPKYITFAHDTLYNDIKNKTQKSLVHEVLKLKIKNPVNLTTAPYLHTSSRVHRNVVDLKKNKIKGDIYLYHTFLDKGPLYYYDKIMSVYNITGKGSWSKLSSADQLLKFNYTQYKLNKIFNYKYDEHYSRNVSNPELLAFFKNILGARIGWKIYILKSNINKTIGR